MLRVRAEGGSEVVRTGVARRAPRSASSRAASRAARSARRVRARGARRPPARRAHHRARQLERRRLVRPRARAARRGRRAAPALLRAAIDGRLTPKGSPMAERQRRDLHERPDRASSTARSRRCTDPARRARDCSSARRWRGASPTTARASRWCASSPTGSGSRRCASSTTSCRCSSRTRRSSRTRPSLLDKKRFDLMTKWLDKLTSHDLSEVDTDGLRQHRRVDRPARRADAARGDHVVGHHRHDLDHPEGQGRRDPGHGALEDVPVPALREGADARGARPAVDVIWPNYAKRQARPPAHRGRC